MDAVLAEPQVLHERTVDCKPAVGKDEAPPPRDGGAYGGGYHPPAPTYQTGYNQGYQQATWAPPPRPWSPPAPSKGQSPKGGAPPGSTDKVFIGGLAPTTTDDTLNMYFSKYGTLVDVVVMKDKVTQKSRGFGFVRYDAPESVERVMADYDHHEIDG